MLQHYRTLIRKPGSELPPDLCLLDVKVAGETADAAHTAPWGRTEGVIFNEDRGEVAFFVVCVYPEGGGPARRILVPLEAVEIAYPEDRSLRDAVLKVDWTPEQLRAQPSFTANDRLPVDRLTGGPPVTSRWMPARPIAVPPGARTHWTDGRQAALFWGLLAAGMGAVIGLLIQGLLIAATLALFFGIGAAIAGFLLGASREPAADASEFDATRPIVVLPEIERLERALRHPDRRTWSFLEQTRIIPTALPRSARDLRLAAAPH